MHASTATAKTSSAPTPLLDRLAPLPSPEPPGAGSKIIVAVSAGLVLAAAALLLSWDPPYARSLARWIHARFAEELAGRTGAGLLLTGCSAIVAAFAVILVHEAGHVVGGLCAGFRFHSLAIGPLKVDRSFRIARHRGTLAWSGGWVGMLPDKRDHLRLRALALVAAGPGCSLLCGVAVLLLPSSGGLGSAVFALGSIAGGLIELLPIRSRAVAFDGWRLLQLCRDGKWSERWLALMRLSSDLQHGVPPEALPAGDLAKAVALQDASADTVSAHALAYASAFHRHEDAEAAQRLETCLRTSGWAAPAVREALMSDAAVFQARRRKRADLAEQWLADLPDRPQLLWLRTRVEAAVLEAQGDLEAASGKLERYEGALLALPLPSQAQRDMLLRAVRKWKAELRRG